MTEQEPERRDYSWLADAVARSMREELAKLTVPEEIHRVHHAFVAEWLEQQRRKRERAEKIKTQVGGWAIVTLLGGIGKLGYDAFLYFKEHLK